MTDLSQRTFRAVALQRAQSPEQLDHLVRITRPFDWMLILAICIALVAAIMGSFVAGLDATVVNVALPSIREDLGGGLKAQQWVSNAYLLTLGSWILGARSLGDLDG